MKIGTLLRCDQTSDHPLIGTRWTRRYGTRDQTAVVDKVEPRADGTASRLHFHREDILSDNWIGVWAVTRLGWRMDP